MPLRNGLKGQLFIYIFTATSHHRLSRIAIFEKRSNSGAETRLVAIPNQQTSASLSNKLSTTAIIGDNHRRTTQQTLKWHQAKDLIGRWIDQHIGIGQQCQTVFALYQANKVHSPSSLCSNGGTHSTHIVASYHQLRRGHRIIREGRNQVLHTFSRRDPAEVRNNGT
jgi:hypothetical protein